MIANNETFYNDLIKKRNQRASKLIAIKNTIHEKYKKRYVELEKRRDEISSELYFLYRKEIEEVNFAIKNYDSE